jgi:hypothetical protein
MTGEEIREELRCGRPRCGCQRGRNVHCPVPAHSDDNPSLTVSDRDNGKVLVHCKSGCGQEAVIEVLRERGLWHAEPPGLTLAQLAEAKGLPVEFLHDEMDWRDGNWHGTPAVLMPYADVDGTVLFQRYRIRLKGDRFRQPKGTKLSLYGLNRLIEAKHEGRLFIVEGESDAATLAHAGIPCVSLPGAEAWTLLYSLPEWARELEVILWPDRDEAGERMVVRVARAGSLLFSNLRAIIPPSWTKDANDAWQDVKREAGAFRSRVDELISGSRTGTEIMAEIKKREDAARAEAIAEALASAAPLLGDPAVLHRAIIAVEHLGHVGDRRNTGVIYVSLTSRLSDRPMSVVTKGPASSGSRTGSIRFFAFYRPVPTKGSRRAHLADSCMRRWVRAAATFSRTGR